MNIFKEVWKVSDFSYRLKKRKTTILPRLKQGVLEDSTSLLLSILGLLKQLLEEHSKFKI